MLDHIEKNRMQDGLLDTYVIPKQIPTTALLAIAPFIVVAPVLASIIAFGIGGAVGGMIGVLIGLGISENKAERHKAEMSRWKESPGSLGIEEIHSRRERPVPLMISH